MHPKDTDPRDHFCPLSSATGIKKRKEGKWKWRVRKRVILQKKMRTSSDKMQNISDSKLQTVKQILCFLETLLLALPLHPDGSSRKSSCASARKGGQVRS